MTNLAPETANTGARPRLCEIRIQIKRAAISIQRLPRLFQLPQRIAEVHPRSGEARIEIKRTSARRGRFFGVAGFTQRFAEIAPHRHQRGICVCRLALGINLFRPPALRAEGAAEIDPGLGEIGLELERPAVMCSRSPLRAHPPPERVSQVPLRIVYGATSALSGTASIRSASEYRRDPG